MMASRILITWLSGKSRSFARYSRGLHAIRNMDVATLPAHDSGGLAWHIWTLSGRMQLRQSVPLAPAGPRSR